MRRFSFLLLGLALAVLGVQVVTGAEVFAPYLLRDGLLLASLGALVFALNAGGWRAMQPGSRVRSLPRLGQTLLLTGGIVALVGGVVAGFGVSGILGLTAWLAWLLGVALLVVGAWWPGGDVEYTLPAVRWSKDEAGNFVPVPGQAEPARAVAPALGRRGVGIWLVVILGVAALLRFWNLADLPPGCVGNECANGLRLVDGQPLLGNVTDQFALFERAARALLAVMGAGVPSLRLAAALAGWLTIPFFFLAARRLATPVNALLATALLALSPWHLWASRSSDPWIVTALLATLALWCSLEALAHANVRWWVLAGLAIGLLFVETPPLRGAIGLWAALVVGLAVVRAWRAPVKTLNRWAGLVGLAAALALALPAIMAGAQGWSQAMAGVALPAGAGAALVSLLGSLLRPDATTTGSFAGAGLLVGFTAALAVVGAGALLRHARQPAAIAVVAGSLLLLAGAVRVDLVVTPPASVLLSGLPFFLALVAVALDRLVGALIQAWGPPLFRPSRLAAAAALVLLLIVGRSTVAFMADLDAVSSGGSGQVETDAARFIARWMLDHPGNATTFVIPPAIYNHPSLRLLAGPALAAGRIQPLDLARTLPYAAEPPGDLLYLLPLQDSQVLDVLGRLYPAGVAATRLDESGQRSLFNSFEVAQADVLATQALQMTVFTGPTVGAGTVQASTVKALDFPWGTQPPLPDPFNAQWSGSLLVPVAGVYDFAVESGAPDAAFSLTLDDLLILDTGLGLTQQQSSLAQGIYRMSMSYRGGAQPGDLRVRWQQPDSASEILQGAALHLPALADQGLLGQYYANNRFEGTPAVQRKDVIVGLDPGLAQPTSVRWQGKLAAPRSGEYLISTVASGLSQVEVDGQLVVDNPVVPDQAEGPSYAEGLIYLAAGWHTIEARYAADGSTPSFRLLWQPAGGDPGELTSQYLLPTVGEVGPVDVPLPPAPTLVDPRLGDDRFALSRASDVWQPKVRIPPLNLPPLPLEVLWIKGNGCGAREEQFDAPHGVAFAGDGSQIYVTDTGNRRVQVYDVDGGFSHSVTSELFQEPVDVEVTPEGAPLVLDALGQQILRVDADGSVNPMALQTGFYRPRGFGLDTQGNLLVADTGGGRLAVVEPDGVLAGSFGGQGSLVGRGQPVDGLAFGDAVWAITAEDGRLWNLATDGSLTAIQPTNTIDGPHLAGLPDGRLLVTDPGRATFMLFSAQGEPLGQFGYPGQFATPTGIAAAPIGNDIFIAVSDTRQCTLSLWRMGGN